MRRYSNATNVIFGFAAAAFLCAFSLDAHANEMKALHHFAGPDGGGPAAALIRDSAGVFYGTTASGGGSPACSHGCGTVFSFTLGTKRNGKPGGKEKVLHAFQDGADGTTPTAALLLDKSGNLYGTTQNGGPANNGVVFKLAPDETETVLYSFTGGTDGAQPSGGLVSDKAGNLYGTTSQGGDNNGGTAFKISPAGAFSVIHTFCALDRCSDGADPIGRLAIDAGGNLYGIARNGGPYGEIFRLTRDGSYTVLYAMSDSREGFEPLGGVIRDKQGNLYGTCSRGGQYTGGGTVFRLTADGAFTVLRSFGSSGSDGSQPMGELVRDEAGNLFGTTAMGGYGQGTAFEIAPDGSETVLRLFGGTPFGYRKGIEPHAGFVLDKDHLYGTTVFGGTPARPGGTIFEIGTR